MIVVGIVATFRLIGKIALVGDKWKKLSERAPMLREGKHHYSSGQNVPPIRHIAIIE